MPNISIECQALCQQANQSCFLKSKRYRQCSVASPPIFFFQDFMEMIQIGMSMVSMKNIKDFLILRVSYELKNQIF